MIMVLVHFLGSNVLALLVKCTLSLILHYSFNNIPSFGILSDGDGGH